MAADKNHIKRRVAAYNLLLNLLWSALSFVPAVVFCYTWVELPLLFLFTGLSLLPAFLSPAMLRKGQLSSRPATYKKLGIALILYLAQDGVFLHSLVRRKYPDYKVVRRERKSVHRLIRQTYVFEKFHLVGCVFFSLLCGYAVSKSLWGWACALGFINLLYNVYPILLQQYIRVKLALFPKSNT
ncbi:MAG TPA: hypothetical protein VHK69_06450 [Chitinophagaceae bacterium]|nr:hypothetical protein [Chitinophagaceae bacterium]